jgi:hypothetical protein
MYIDGIIIGLSTFIFIGVFHPAVIYGEYHFGVKIWPVFLCLGIVFGILSLFINNITIRTITGIIGFCCFWSIVELFHQKKRVEKGWFPKKVKMDNQK